MARNRYYQGPPSEHFDGVRFFNPGQPEMDRSLRDIWRWRREGKRVAWQTDLPASVAKPAAREDSIVITMVGHASLLIQVDGRNLLLDPVWSERVSPFRFAGPIRFDAPGIAFDDLPPVDAVLLTHNHYDHLDLATLARIGAVHRPRIITPLGNDRILARATPQGRVEAGDWGDRFAFGDDLVVTLHPANHWSARGLGDRRMALWCGFVIQASAGMIYIAGDTGYGDGAPFRLVHETFGAPAVAVLPIGAYEPRWFMRPQHVNPAEAVQIMRDCGAGQALGVHWGTFHLTDEPRSAPAEALTAACVAQGIDPARFTALRPGNVWRAPPHPMDAPAPP